MVTFLQAIMQNPDFTMMDKAKIQREALDHLKVSTSFYLAPIYLQFNKLFLIQLFMYILTI